MSAGAHHHHTLAPSGQGTVVLNIGADIGALIIHTPGSLHGHEIEVSPVDAPEVRTHAAVRARYVHDGVRFSVVIDSLRAGRYVIWRDAVTPLAEADVMGGSVTEYEWPQEGAAAA
ncbi:hypothetical protein EV385_0133 [Krasilnikovia cinnamomea]|uniref:Phospholipase n=1 Tax=Krasilnikovia cinnamomea TaxID=349313 RepID=A0A4Q7ZEN4_9ACTN|nr:phospholipase [Krasilnikovia cinnamomea]RZU48419.1 hypothetical protein EV385_0133 [Krasilnikovia cinnamomea]